MMTQAEKNRLRRLRQLYDIQGDGVARLRMEKAVKDKALRETVMALKNMPIEADSDREDTQATASQ